MSADRETLRAYAAQAQRYSTLVSRDAPDRDLSAFMDALPKAAHVLDLGCGPGNSAAMMQARGFSVIATDASPEMVDLARAAGVTAEMASFDDLDAVDAYDGIWANFSLLHAPRADLPRHLAACARALRPGGTFHIGMKTGTGAERDRYGRHYTYVTRSELERLIADAGLATDAVREGRMEGLTGAIEPFVILRAAKPAP
ncbi:MAG: class I SAM-dependent methyltransferase [Pseudomonadota bacterium]